MSDPAKYRTREEVDAMRKQHDPIDQIRDLLKGQNVDDVRLKEVDSAIKAKVMAATDLHKLVLNRPKQTADDILPLTDAQLVAKGIDNSY